MAVRDCVLSMAESELESKVNVRRQQSQSVSLPEQAIWGTCLYFGSSFAFSCLSQRKECCRCGKTNVISESVEDLDLI